MTVRHLKIFVAVCEEGSITKAGKKLYLSQPTVSLAIAELERHYQVPLFDRISKRLYITEAGKRFLQYAQHITSVFDEMESTMQDWHNSGSLRIGTSITIGNRLLPGLLQQFKKSRPNTQVTVQIDNSEKIEQAVLENHVDIGLIEGVAHSPYICSEDFCDDELVLVCPPGHPWAAQASVPLTALQKEPLIMREKGSGGREIIESMLKLHAIEITPAWESVSTQAIVQAVTAGLGVAILPRLLVEQPLAQGLVEQATLRDISLKRKFSIIHHQNKYLAAPALEFIQLCTSGQG